MLASLFSPSPHPLLRQILRPSASLMPARSSLSGEGCWGRRTRWGGDQASCPQPQLQAAAAAAASMAPLLTQMALLSSADPRIAQPCCPATPPGCQTCEMVKSLECCDWCVPVLVSCRSATTGCSTSGSRQRAGTRPRRGDEGARARSGAAMMMRGAIARPLVVQLSAVHGD